MFWLSGIISDDKLVIFFKVIFSLSDSRHTVWFWVIRCLFLLMPTPFPAQTVVRKPHTWEFAQCLSSPQCLSFLMKLFYFHLRLQCIYYCSPSFRGVGQQSCFPSPILQWHKLGKVYVDQSGNRAASPWPHIYPNHCSATFGILRWKNYRE